MKTNKWLNLFAVFCVLSCSILLYSCFKENTTTATKDTQDPSLTPLAGNACFDAAKGVDCQPFDTIFNIENLPNYPGCIFPVKIHYCVQKIGGFTNIILGNFEMQYHNCTKFIDSLGYYLATNGEADEDAFISRFDKMVYAQLENHLFSVYATSNNNCNGSNPGVFKLSFVRQSCSAICFVQIDPTDKDPKGDGNGGGLVDQNTESRSLKANAYIRSNCTSQGCCRRDVVMCYDPSTNTVVKTVTVLPFSLNGQTPLQTCAGGIIQNPTLPSYIKIVKCNACTYKCD